MTGSCVDQILHRTNSFDACSSQYHLGEMVEDANSSLLASLVLLEYLSEIIVGQRLNNCCEMVRKW